MIENHRNDDATPVVPVSQLDALDRPAAGSRSTPGSARPSVSISLATRTSTGARFSPGAIVSERYRIVRLLGRGGMGEVYLAHDRKLEQSVALKFLPTELEKEPNRLSRLLAEAGLARTISHPNVCRVYDIAEVDGNHFISMEYIEGEDLGSLLRRARRLPRDRVIDMGVSLCRGLAAVHQRGILHRDLKPSNLMIDRHGRPHITDFGLASRVADAKARSTAHGTPAYMAPELLSGGTLSIQSDIYALGLVLYKMLTGQSAHQGRTPRELAESRKKPPSRPSELIGTSARSIESTILRCLAPEPDNRPATARDVATELLGASSQQRAALKAVVICRGTLRNESAAGGESLARIARELLHARDDCELIDAPGGETVGLLFDRPRSAVAYALSAQRATSEGPGLEPHGVQIAIHLGEVLPELEPGLDAASERSAPKAGLLAPRALEATCRLSALAHPGQILLTRAAFDLARQGAIDGFERVIWLAHGSYELAGLDEPVDVFEVGEECNAANAPLCAPADSPAGRRQMAQDAIPGWRPAPGQPMPGRASWLIAEKLGDGGFGEVWLAEHDATGERRAFKFCYDRERLRALQREITVFRLLQESLGSRRDIARIIDWNLDKAPYFIESAYTAGGSLTTWVESRDGLASIPLADRLELVAQVATALAAAHSVGILHKDIKPGNVLMATDAESGAACAQLSDFGIGSITDRLKRDCAGITLLGFTEAASSVSGPAVGVGTRLYMAPELLEGKRATIQADIYALGVLLYQLIAGDFSRALAPGWERDIDDELLRADIAAAVDGSPERRLADASRLAERLRTLEARRSEQRALRRQHQETREALQALARARRRRTFVGLSLAIVLIFAGAMAIQSHRVAQQSLRVAREAETARQVSRFLVDLFAVSDPYAQHRQKVTLEDVLARGAERIKGELDALPAVQARLMHILGIVHGQLGRYERAIELLKNAVAIRRRLPSDSPIELAESLHELAAAHYKQTTYDEASAPAREALEIRHRIQGDEHVDIAATLALLGNIEYQRKNLIRAESLHRAASSMRKRLLGDTHSDVAASLHSLASLLTDKGEYKESESLYRQALHMYRQSLGNSAPQLVRLLRDLAMHMQLRHDYARSEPLLREALGLEEQILGDEHPRVATLYRDLAFLLIWRGQHAEAAESLERALAIYEATVGPESNQVAGTLHIVGRMHYGQRNYDDSLSYYLRALAIYDRLQHGNELGITITRHHAGLTMRALGRLDEAEANLVRALHGYKKLFGPDHQRVALTQVNIAETLAARGNLDEAKRLLTDAIEQLRAIYPRANWRLAHAESVAGYLQAKQGHLAAAHPLLASAQRALEQRLGKYHHYTQGARMRLAELCAGQRREASNAQLPCAGYEQADR